MHDDMHQQLTEVELDALKDHGLYFDSGTRDVPNQPMAMDDPACLDRIMNSYDYGSIEGDNLKGVVQELQRHLVASLEKYLGPEKDKWGQFLNILTDIALIPPSLLQKAEDLTDIMNILKSGKFSKRHLQPLSTLMKSVSQTDSRYSTSVETIYNKIVKLDKKYRMSVKVKRTAQEENAQMAADGVGRWSFTANPTEDDTSSEEEVREEEEEEDVGPIASTRDYFFLGRTTRNRGYFCSNTLHEYVSPGCAICDGRKRPIIAKRKRLITI